MAARFYPPASDRRVMRALLLRHLHDKPAEFVADALIDHVMANGGGERGVDVTELSFELSRMIGTDIRLNPNNTLVATD